MSDKMKQILKAILLVVVVVIIGIGIAVAIKPNKKEGNSNTQKEVTEITTNLKITFDDKELTDTVVLKPNATVVDQYVETEIAEFDDELGYVTGINDRNAAGMCGWVFEINDKPVAVGANEATLNDKDTVHWFWSCYEG